MKINNKERIEAGLPKIKITTSGMFTEPKDLVRSEKFTTLLEKLSKINIMNKDIIAD